MGDKYVFISYKSDEKQNAIEIKLALQANGIWGWMDESEIMAGDNYAARIDEAVRDSSAVLLVLSNKAMSSAHIRSELTLALKYSRPVYAYVIEECSPNAEFNFDLPPEKRCEAFKNKDRAMSTLLAYLKAEIEADNQNPYDVSEFFKKRRRFLKEKSEGRTPASEILTEMVKQKFHEFKENTASSKKLYKTFPLNLTPYAREYSQDKYVRFALNIHTVLVLALSIIGAVMLFAIPIPAAWIVGVIYALATFVIGENIVGFFSRLIAKTKSRLKIALLSLVTLYVSFWIILFVIAFVAGMIQR